MKRISTVMAFILVFLSMFSATGCEPEQGLLTPQIPVLNNDLADGKLNILSSVPGESFTFLREYSTGYDAKQWRITDSKNLAMKAWVDNAKGITVLVEHVHIDISLKSRIESLDGWPQDFMDDSLHTGSQPGFWITDKYPYENIFAIEGFSQTLIEGWGFAVGGFGQVSIDESRLTETNLVRYGRVYANKVQVVYDLLIKNADEPYFHTRSIIDEFLVPVAK